MANLKLGLQLGYWGSHPPPQAGELAVEADRLGFDSVWTAEAYGSDALTPLAWWGQATERVRLGTALCQLSARSPTAMAMAAITMDHLSGGRFVLGLGVSGLSLIHIFFKEKRLDPHEDLMSALTQVELDGERLGEMELELFFLLLTVAGNETTRNLMSGAMATFFDHPDQWERLRADRDVYKRQPETRPTNS